MTIEEFVRARLAEDEQIAKAAAGDSAARWVADEDEVYAVFGSLTNPDRCEDHAPGRPNTCEDNRVATADDCSDRWLDERARHIARHDPASVLLRVAPLRELLEFYAEVRHIWQGDYLKADFTLGKLASIWRGHPDYRPEWNA